MQQKSSRLFRWLILISLIAAFVIPTSSFAQNPVYLPIVSSPGSDSANAQASSQAEAEQTDEARPYGVIVTPIDDTTVVISWETTSPQTGWVTYGVALDTLDQVAYDDYGQDVVDTTHSVTITGLQFGQVYYFAIVSGGMVYDNSGSWYKLHLGAMAQVDAEAPIEAASTDASQAPDEEQIVGGQNANPGEYPWQAMLLRSGGSFFCGGSLIERNWVLTAAHCLDGINVGQVVLGAHNRTQTNESSRQTIAVRRTIIHPDYNSSTFDNDIGLIELSTSAVLNSRVALVPWAVSPTDDPLFAPGVLATVTGWGATAEGGSLANVLQEVSIPIVNRQTCNQAYGGGITANMLCAGLPEGGKDSCQGDSGGPLIVPNGGNRWKLAGIVSWGNGCARPDFYGVYTVVANYNAWIQQNMSDPSGDPDDDRVLSSGRTLNGTINPANDLDTYYFDITTQPQLATIRMNRTSGSLDSYLILYAPNGDEVARDDDSGGNLNSLINRATLSQTGRYRIVASSFAGASTGGYTISLDLVTVNGCTPGANGVVLYEHRNYRGRCITFTGDDVDFNIHGFNDMASSLQFVGSYASGWEAVLYEHTYYGGVYSTFRANDPDLRGDTVGNDRASSIRIQRVTTISNLALNRPSFATSQQGSSYTPARGNDGNTSTRWASRNNAAGDQWWWVDVGNNQTFDRVTVRWHANYAASYFIGWSNDGTNFYGYWFTVNSAGNYNHNLGTQTARYVGLLMRTRAPSKRNYSFWELEVYHTSALSAVEAERVGLEATELAPDGDLVTITMVQSSEENKQFLPFIQQ